MNWINVADDDI